MKLLEYAAVKQHTDNHFMAIIQAELS